MININTPQYKEIQFHSHCSTKATNLPSEYDNSTFFNTKLKTILHMNFATNQFLSVSDFISNKNQFIIYLLIVFVILTIVSLIRQIQSNLGFISFNIKIYCYTKLYHIATRFFASVRFIKTLRVIENLHYTNCIMFIRIITLHVHPYICT